mgnify:CR=1 FL=1
MAGILKNLRRLPGALKTRSPVDLPTCDSVPKKTPPRVPARIDDTLGRQRSNDRWSRHLDSTHIQRITGHERSRAYGQAPGAGNFPNLS